MALPGFERSITMTTVVWWILPPVIADSRRFAKARPPPSSYVRTLTFLSSLLVLTSLLNSRAVVSGSSSLTYWSRNLVIKEDLPDFFSPTNMNDLLCVLALSMVSVLIRMFTYFLLVSWLQMPTSLWQLGRWFSPLVWVGLFAEIPLISNYIAISGVNYN